MGDRLREVSVDRIAEAVKNLCIEANVKMPVDLTLALKDALLREESPTGKGILEKVLENHRIALEEAIPACQDTGVAVVFLEIGQDVHLCGGDVVEAINRGVREGYTEGYLRKSVVKDPLFARENSGDNTPAVLHVTVVPGNRLRVTVMPKGAGAENASALRMLPPHAGVEGVKRFVVETVKAAGPDACPPYVVGVGIGGTFDEVTLLAKKALVRPLGSRHADPQYAALEGELVDEINRLGIGPQGLGGSVTALGVHIEVAPCHIASLPVAVNLNCNVSRVARAVL